MAVIVVSPTVDLPAGETITPSVSWPTSIPSATFTFTSSNWQPGGRIGGIIETSVDGGVAWRQISSFSIPTGSLLGAGMPATTVDRQQALWNGDRAARTVSVLPDITPVRVRMRLNLSAPCSLGLTVTL